MVVDEADRETRLIESREGTLRVSVLIREAFHHNDDTINAFVERLPICMQNRGRAVFPARIIHDSSSRNGGVAPTSAKSETRVTCGPRPHQSSFPRQSLPSRLGQGSAIQRNRS
jgi:hypothetical protein